MTMWYWKITLREIVLHNWALKWLNRTLNRFLKVVYSAAKNRLFLIIPNNFPTIEAEIQSSSTNMFENGEVFLDNWTPT